MSKEKLLSLQNYLNNLNNRKNSGVPDKHKDHPIEFIKFLDNEIRLVTSKIDAAKLEMGGK